MIRFELIDYHEYDELGWYAFGIHYGLHAHCEPRHGHIWIDLGRWCIEITIGTRKYWQFIEEQNSAARRA